MIKVEKVEGFSNCNNCGKYNIQPTYTTISKERMLPENDNDIYDYHLLFINGGIYFRLCNKCAKELIEQLYKQVNNELRSELK